MSRLFQPLTEPKDSERCTAQVFGRMWRGAGLGWSPAVMHRCKKWARDRGLCYVHLRYAGSSMARTSAIARAIELLKANGYTVLKIEEGRTVTM